ncbi:MAG: hypothetical protein RSC30_07120, partial [Oscillospiraceae bacterium]
EKKYILKLNYEDKYATPKEHTQEFTINAKIYKNPYEDENAPVDGETNAKPNGTSKWVIIGCSAVGVAIIAASAVVYKKKKAKKAALNIDDSDEL